VGVGHKKNGTQRAKKNDRHRTERKSQRKLKGVKTVSRMKQSIWLDRDRRHAASMFFEFIKRPKGEKMKKQNSAESE